MLLYKKGRFYSGAVSFALPDNCYLVIAEAMNYYENGLEITTVDEEFSVAISTQYDETDTRFLLILDSKDSVRQSLFKRENYLVITLCIKTEEINIASSIFQLKK